MIPSVEGSSTFTYILYTKSDGFVKWTNGEKTAENASIFGILKKGAAADSCQWKLPPFSYRIFGKFSAYISLSRCRMKISEIRESGGSHDPCAVWGFVCPPCCLADFCTVLWKFYIEATRTSACFCLAAFAFFASAASAERSGMHFLRRKCCFAPV